MGGDNSEYIKLEVGKLYVEGKTKYQDGVYYAFSRGSHVVTVSVNGLHQSEINDFNTGDVSFALTYRDGIIFLLLRIGTFLDWSDAPYTWYMVSPENRIEPPTEIGENERALVTMFLVEGRSGILEAIRVVSLSHNMTVKLYETIRRQKEAFDGIFNQEAYDRALERVQRMKTAHQLRREAIAVCHVPGASN